MAMQLGAGGGGGAKKRARADGAPPSRKSTAKKMAYFSAKKYPWADYGRTVVRRGTEENIGRFGATYASADETQRAARESMGYQGRGLYQGRGGFSNAANGYRGRGLYQGRGGFFSDIGSSIGDLFGGGHGDLGKAGRNIGHVADMVMPMLMGRGLYTSNHLVQGAGMSRQPIVFDAAPGDNQGFILTNKEYVGDVFGPASAAFTNTAYSLNPGLGSNFPMLAQFAANFDEYEMIQMVFEFHSTVDASATNNASGNTGTIIMCTNYKADSQLYQTKEEMIQAHGGVSGRLTEPLIHGVECEPSLNAVGGMKFVRTQVVPNSDVKLYDMGLFQLAIQNIPTAFQNQQVGELWVHYKVKLSKPKLTTALAGAQTAARFVSNGSESSTSWMGTNILSAQTNTFVPQITQISKGIVVTFPSQTSGVFEVKFWAKGTVFAAGGTWATVAGNVQAHNDIFATQFGGAGDVANYLSACTQTDSTALVIRVRIQTATGATANVLTLYPVGATGTATTVTESYIEVTEIGAQFATSNSIAQPLFVNTSGVVTGVPAV